MEWFCTTSFLVDVFQMCFMHLNSFYAYPDFLQFPYIWPFWAD